MSGDRIPCFSGMALDLRWWQPLQVFPLQAISFPDVCMVRPLRPPREPHHLVKHQYWKAQLAQLLIGLC